MVWFPFALSRPRSGRVEGRTRPDPERVHAFDRLLTFVLTADAYSILLFAVAHTDFKEYSDMANPTRLRRVADQIQRELSELLRLEVKDPRVGMVTLTGVEVSSDFAHAKVYYTSLATQGREETQDGLQRAAGFLRSQLGPRLRIHNTPELHFQYDASIEEGVRLSNLIDEAVKDSALDDNKE